MGSDSELILNHSEAEYDRNDVEEQNFLCHSHNSLNLETTRKSLKI
jgi:hypothetical protein